MASNHSGIKQFKSNKQFMSIKNRYVLLTSLLFIILSILSIGCSKKKDDLIDDQTPEVSMYRYNESITQRLQYEPFEINFVPDENGNVGFDSPFIGSDLPENLKNLLVICASNKIITLSSTEDEEQEDCSIYCIDIQRNDPTVAFFDSVPPDLSERILGGSQFQRLKSTVGDRYTPELVRYSLIEIWSIAMDNEEAVIKLRHTPDKGIIKHYTLWLRKHRKGWQVDDHRVTRLY